MMHYTAWKDGRLVRRELPVMGQQTIAFGFGFVLTVLGGLVMLLSLGCASADGHPPPSPGAQQEPYCEVSPGIEYLAWADDQNTHVMLKDLATSAVVVRTLQPGVWSAEFPNVLVYVDPETFEVCEAD